MQENIAIENVLVDTLDNIIVDLDAVVRSQHPKVIVENDGIGAYEFWGAKGFDAGHDTIVVEEPDTDYPFEYPAISDRLLNKVADLINDLVYEGEAYKDSGYGWQDYRIYWTLAAATVKGKTLILTVEWNEVEI